MDENAGAKDEDVLEISKRLLAQNKEAYEVLAVADGSLEHEDMLKWVLEHQE